jgi:hypothetical protein
MRLRLLCGAAALQILISRPGHQTQRHNHHENDDKIALQSRNEPSGGSIEPFILNGRGEAAPHLRVTPCYRFV